MTYEEILKIENPWTRARKMVEYNKEMDAMFDEQWEGQQEWADYIASRDELKS